MRKIVFIQLRSYIIYSQLVAVVVIATQIVNLNMAQITGIWKLKSLAIPTGSLFPLPLPLSSPSPCSQTRKPYVTCDDFLEICNCTVKYCKVEKLNPSLYNYFKNCDPSNTEEQKVTTLPMILVSIFVAFTAEGEGGTVSTLVGPRRRPVEALNILKAIELY